VNIETYRDSDPLKSSRRFEELCNESKIDSNDSIPYIYSIDVFKDDESIDIDPKLSDKDRCELNEIIRLNYLNLSNIPAIQHSYEMRLRLKSEEPVRSVPRRLSYQEKKEVDLKIDELLKKGFIRESNSPYSSAIVLVKKKSGEKRMCVDYRQLNKITIRDGYPLPLIDDCLERLEGNKYFTLLDLKSGYHQVKVAESSVQYTAFVTPSGQYEYTRMPFGLMNAPAVFMRFINFILQPLIREGNVVVYIDDIAIGSKTLNEHFTTVGRVLRILAEYRLEIKISKCQFAYESIEFLGYTLSGKGISPNYEHTSTIKHLPIPKDRHGMQKCLGLFSYFRRFIPAYSKIAKPLQELTKVGAKYELSEDCINIFEYLREKLISFPILSLYNPNRETELHCDASSEGFGGILLQKQDDSKFHPIAYFSQRATKLEARYESFKLETLAVVYSLRKFRIYLEGIPFNIVTDCNAVVLCLGKGRLNSSIARWALELANYNYTLKHRSGKYMTHVDTLSRYPSALNENFEYEPVVNIQGRDNKDQIVSVIDSDDINLQLQITQNRDSIIVKLKEQLELGIVKNFILNDGIVYRLGENDIELLYVPAEMESHIIRRVHENLCHLGTEKCLKEIMRHYWFPNMKSKIEAFIGNCLNCIMFTVPTHANNRTLHNIPKRPIPFDTLHIDHFGPLPSVISKKKHLLVIIDGFTKFVKLFPVNSTSTKEVNICFSKYFQYYSRPRRIVSDRGTCFTSLEFAKFLLENNIEHVKVATASPQANGQVERVNRTVKAMLAKITEPIKHEDWSKLLVKAEYAINNSMHSTTKELPSVLLFGVQQRGCNIDALTEYLDDRNDIPQCDLVNVRKNSSDKIEQCQKRSKEYFQKNHKNHVEFAEGDFVVMRNIDTTIGTNKKFVPKYKGPYIVKKVLPNDRYVVSDIENCQISQIPYDGIVEACRLRKWADWRNQCESNS